MEVLDLGVRELWGKFNGVNSMAGQYPLRKVEENIATQDNSHEAHIYIKNHGKKFASLGQQSGK